jgi:hypothetical protein
VFVYPTVFESPTGLEFTDSKWNSHPRNIGQRKNTPRNQICGVKPLLINYQAE